MLGERVGRSGTLLVAVLSPINTEVSHAIVVGTGEADVEDCAVGSDR